LWTSLVLSISGYKYYLVIIDDFSHYSWTFPLCAKSDTFPTLLHFFAWMSTQFGLTVKAVQCNNGREFDNSTSRSFSLPRFSDFSCVCLVCILPHRTARQSACLVYVIRNFISSLQQEFAMKGLSHHFVGVTVEPRQAGLLLHQRQYILERAGMTDCKPCSTLVDTQAKLFATLGDLVAYPTAYRSLAGALQYLTFTKPDLTYAVQQICLHMHDPRESHLAALKRLLRYVQGTVDFGLVLHRSPSAVLVVYTDADWAGCPDTRRSTSGYVVFLDDNLISWSSKRQLDLSLEC
jgi:hypothetical protein